MSPAAPPESLSVPLSALVNLGVEFWRVANWLASADLDASDTAPVRHALRRMEDFCKLCDLEIRAMEGRPYDPGLACRVVDATDDPRLPEGQTIIDETLSPMILWKGQVLKPADIATRRGTGPTGK